LKQIPQDLQSLQLWRQQDELQREKERIERETHLDVLEEELRLLRKKDVSNHRVNFKLLYAQLSKRKKKF